MELNDYYLADSYKDLETVGGIYEKDGKEYIDVVLKSGKTHAARVYRPRSRAATSSIKPKTVIYDLFSELGFKPSHYVYIIKTDEEEKLKNICHWYPGIGAYMKCTEDIFELPSGCKIEKLYWTDICDNSLTHLLPKETIASIVREKFIDKL